MSIEVNKLKIGDVLSFDFVSVVIVRVEYFDVPCVCWYGLVCVVIRSEKNDREVEISFVATMVVVSPRFDLFLWETGITAVDMEDTYLCVFFDVGGNEFGIVTVDVFGVLAGFETLFLIYDKTTISY